MRGSQTSRLTRELALEFVYTTIRGTLRDPGFKTKDTERAMSGLVTGMSTLEIKIKVRCKVQVFTSGSTETPMMGIGLMDLNMAMACGKTQLAVAMLVSGK